MQWKFEENKFFIQFCSKRPLQLDQYAFRETTSVVSLPTQECSEVKPYWEPLQQRRDLVVENCISSWYQLRVKNDSEQADHACA